MPDYAEQAIKDGWYQDGSKWKHKGKPGKIYYNAKQIWDEDLPEKLKRPYSATPLEPKPVEVVTGAGGSGGDAYKPIDVHAAKEIVEAGNKAISDEAWANYQAEQAKPKKTKIKGFKRDPEGYLVPKDE